MPKYSWIVKNVGDESMSRRAPSAGLPSALIAFLYLLILIAFLKILKIIPDPPEAFDVTALIINFAVLAAGSLGTYLYNSFRNMQTKLGDIDSKLKDLGLEIAHLRDYLDLSTRIARLEAKKE